MKPKTLALLKKMARDEAKAELDYRTSPGYFHVISIRFEDGQAVDLPYSPMQPRQTLDLPGKWVRDA